MREPISDGAAITNTNDTTTAARRLADSLSAYYLLGYYSTNTATDGRYREIEVKVRQSRVDVSARPGYFAPTPEILAVHPDTLVVGEPVSLYVTLNSVDGVVAVMLGSYGLSALRALSGSVLRGVVPAGPLDEPGILEVTAIAFAAGTSIESEPVSIPVVRRPSVTSIDPTSVEAGSSGATSRG